jgi:RND family efflux transporter MFP subunit
VLSTSDVAAARTTSIEAGVPITGDLRPAEVVDVRARLEGDLLDVHVREGDRVREGQLLARFDATEQEANLGSAQAEQAAARSEVETAGWNAEQADELFRAGAISEQEARAARQQEVAARARLAAADARLRSSSVVNRDTRVLSPTSGVVEKRNVESGQRVTRGESMFTVVRNDVLELEASVPARHASDVRAGQRVHFAADGRALEGTLARVSPTIDPTSRSITVYARVPNADGRLKGNTFATGRVVGRTVADALVVPSTAIRQGQGDDGAFVYRIAGEQIERVPVRVGIVDEARQLAQILDGLAAGDRVIVGNVGALGTGTRVQIVGEGSGPANQEAGAADGTADSAADSAAAAPAPRP